MNFNKGTPSFHPFSHATSHHEDRTIKLRFMRRKHFLLSCFDSCCCCYFWQFFWVTSKRDAALASAVTIIIIIFVVFIISTFTIEKLYTELLKLHRFIVIIKLVYFDSISQWLFFFVLFHDLKFFRKWRSYEHMLRVHNRFIWNFSTEASVRFTKFFNLR